MTQERRCRSVSREVDWAISAGDTTLSLNAAGRRDSVLVDFTEPGIWQFGLMVTHLT